MNYIKCLTYLKNLTLMKKLFSLTESIFWWSNRNHDSVRQSFNIEHYFKVLKAKGVIK